MFCAETSTSPELCAVAVAETSRSNAISPALRQLSLLMARTVKPLQTSDGWFQASQLPGRFHQQHPVTFAHTILFRRDKLLNTVVPNGRSLNRQVSTVGRVEPVGDTGFAQHGKIDSYPAIVCRRDVGD